MTPDIKAAPGGGLKKYTITKNNLKSTVYGVPEISSAMARFESRMMDLQTNGLDRNGRAYGKHQDDIRMEFVETIAAHTAREVEKAEKAYGGCHNCYGKGYATALDFTHGEDTDWDIGGRGQVIHYQNPVMRYCTCNRGEQLRAALSHQKTGGQDVQ